MRPRPPPLLVLPAKFIGSYYPGGFYSSDQLQAFAITPNTSGVLRLSQGSVSLKGVSLAQEAFVDEIPRACGWSDFGLYLVIPWTFAVRPSSEGLFELKDDAVRGTVKLEIKRTSSGRTVYCGS